MESEALAKLRADVFSRVETCALEIRDQRFNVCVGLPVAFSHPQSQHFINFQIHGH